MPDTPITFGQNTERRDLIDNFTTADNRLGQIIQNVEGSTLAQTQTAVRDMAVIQRRLLRHLRRQAAGD